jgi:hypothetical protein
LATCVNAFSSLVLVLPADTSGTLSPTNTETIAARLGVTNGNEPHPSDTLASNNLSQRDVQPYHSSDGAWQVGEHFQGQ